MTCPPGTYFQVRGEGQPIILVHGAASSLRDWDLLAPALNGAGFCTYAVDLFGHGESLKPNFAEENNIERVFRHLTDWIDGIELLEPPVMIGHSLGGYLALLYALRQPGNVRRLVLVNPLISPQQVSPLLRWFTKRPRFSAASLNQLPEYLIYLAARFDFRAGLGLPAPICRQMAIDCKRTSPFIAYLLQNIHDLEPDVAQLQIPALVLWGERDPSLNPRSFPCLVNTLPHAVGCPIPSAGHHPHRSHSGLVLERVLRFISGDG